MTDPTQQALIAHLQSIAASAEAHAADVTREAARLTAQLTQYRDFVAALKSAARHDAPITPGFIHSTLDAYGLVDEL